MTYQVLARKWRPRTFNQLIGQSHVVTALQNAISQARLHHAYLFTGTRGVGKTTIARVLAKALNCHEGPTIAPCLSCTACKAIEHGTYPDLIEIDAASRTRVEDTREILDNVQYLPTQGRYKIYLIDEVHMLSGHSFNALLKTLEEPPRHVVFLLATTDPQKIPITVLSRCLQFTLKPLTSTDIADYLARVCEGESVHYQQDALSLLAIAAAGSVRDSLSLLDQAIAFSDCRIEVNAVVDMLGLVGDELIFEILGALADASGSRLLAICQQIKQEGADYAKVLERMLDIFHQISLVQCIAGVDNQTVSHPIKHFACTFSKEQVQLWYDISLKGKGELSLLAEPSIGFEMTLLRMLVFEMVKPEEPWPELTYANEASVDVAETAVTLSPISVDDTDKKCESVTPTEARLNDPQSEKLSASEETSVVKSADLTNALHYPTIEASAMQEQRLGVSPASVVQDSPTKKKLSAVEVASQKPNDIASQWCEIVTSLKLDGLAKTVLAHSILLENRDGVVTIGIEANYQAMVTSNVLNKIEQALGVYLSCSCKVLMEIVSHNKAQTPAQINTKKEAKVLADARQVLQEDPCLNRIISQFDGKIDDNSIKVEFDKL